MASARGSAQRTMRASLGDKVPRRNLLRALALPALLALPACPAWADGWELVPSLSLSEAYTDNVSLAPDASKQSEWVTLVDPVISLTATGSRSRFNVTYAPEVVYYAGGRRENRVIQRGSAAGNTELVNQLLYIEAGARVDQYDISLQGPLTTSNVNTTGNRATVTTSSISPYLLRDFGSAVRTEARFTYSNWSSDDATALPDNQSNRINLRLASGPAYELLTWDLGYSKETIEYETRQEETFTEAITANARWRITPTVGLLAQAGYDRNNSGVPGLELEQSNWRAGLEWTPTRRTSVSATAGKRFENDTYNFAFRHRTRLTTWSVGYNEDVSTSRSEFFAPTAASTAVSLDPLFSSQFPDPEERLQAVEEFIARTGLPPSLSGPVNFFSDQLFLAKRWRASTGLLGVRNTLVANAFTETRNVSFGGVIRPGSGDFKESSSIRLTGAGLAWSRRMAARKTWNLGMGYSRSEFPDSKRVDDSKFVQMGLTWQFQRRFSGSLNYRRQQNDSNSSGFDYAENSVFATLQVF